VVCEIESSRPYGVNDVAAHGTAWVVQGTEIVGAILGRSQTAERPPAAVVDLRRAAGGAASQHPLCQGRGSRPSPNPFGQVTVYLWAPGTGTGVPSRNWCGKHWARAINRSRKAVAGSHPVPPFKRRRRAPIAVASRLG